VRIDGRRTQTIKESDVSLGARTRARVVINKIAPPFRDAEFDIMFDRGISYEGDLLDLATIGNIVEKSGAWYTYKEVRLGQGRENAKQFIHENGDLADEIRQAVLTSRGLLNAKRAAEADSAKAEAAAPA
jgi:recombination protein RecA